MGDNVYEMNIAQFAILLATASKYVPFGIYAVKKDGINIVLRNDRMCVMGQSGNRYEK